MDVTGGFSGRSTSMTPVRRAKSKIPATVGHFDQNLRWKFRQSRHRCRLQVRRLITKSLRLAGGIRSKEGQVGGTDTDVFGLSM